MINTSWGQGPADGQQKPRQYRRRVEHTPPKPREARLDPFRYYRSVTNAMTGPDDPARVYFSQRNLDHIQNMIISRAYNESKGRIDIGPQNVQIILNKMIEEYTRYPYEQEFQPEPDPHPMQTINRNVVDALMPEVYNGIRVYINFQRTGGHTPQSKMEVGEDARAALKDEKVKATYDPGEFAGPIRGCGPRHYVGARPRELKKKPQCEPGGNTEGQEVEEKKEWQDLRDRFIRNATKGQI